MCECKCSCNCNDEHGEPPSLSIMFTAIITIGFGTYLHGNGYELSELQNILFWSWVLFFVLMAVVTIVSVEKFERISIFTWIFFNIVVVHFIFWICLKIAS